VPAASDLKIFAAASTPDTDSGAVGGAIDLLRTVLFTQIAAADDIEVLSDNAGDTMNCTIEGRNAAGSIISETKALTGTTAAIFSTLGVVDRVLKVELASAPTGIITVRRSVAGATLAAIPASSRGFMMFGRKYASDPAVQKDYYVKVFIKNTHGSTALVGATVKQNADPAGRNTHLLAATKDDTATATTRVTAPGAADTQDPDTFDDTDKTVPGSDLGAGVAIGVWIRTRLPAGDAAHRDTYTLEISGQSV